MKTNPTLWSLILILFCSCGGSSSTDELSKIYNVTTTDRIIGIGQDIILSFDYKTENPNIAVTWFDGEERLNALPRSKNTYYWTPKKDGLRNIKAVITDRNDIITCAAQIKVDKCDLAYGFIGDSKEKILRKFPEAPDDGSCIDYGSSYNIIKNWTTQKYYYKNDKVERIEMCSYKYANRCNELGIRYEHIDKSELFMTLYEDLRSLYGDAYEGTTTIPASHNNDDLYNFSIKNNMVSKFHGPNGKVIKFFIKSGNLKGQLYYQGVVYVGSDGLGEGYRV